MATVHVFWQGPLRDGHPRCAFPENGPDESVHHRLPGGEQAFRRADRRVRHGKRHNVAVLVCGVIKSVNRGSLGEG